MSYTVTEPTRAQDTEVQRGNSWAFQFTCPATDTADVAITWGTFTVSSGQTDTIVLEQTGTPPTVTLSLTAEQTAAITATYVHWYVAEDTAMGGNLFLTGRIKVTAKK